MSSIGIGSILAFFWKIIQYVIVFFNKKQKYDPVADDKKLADAIKRGDSMEVSRIRARKRRYGNLIVLFLLIMTCGCCLVRKPSIPLTGGDVAYQLPAGLYIDSQGKQHNEANPRWSLSEEDLFNNTREIKKSENWFEYVKKHKIAIGGTIIIILVIVKFIVVALAPTKGR